MIGTTVMVQSEFRMFRLSSAFLAVCSDFFTLLPFNHPDSVDLTIHAQHNDTATELMFEEMLICQLTSTRSETE